MFLAVGAKKWTLICAALASLPAFAEKPRDWSGEIVGAASRFRSDTGITHPILYALPVWSRSNAADLDLISRNTAGLSAIDDTRRRFVPVSLSGTVVGKAYDLTNAYTAPGPNGQQILSDLAADDNQVQRVRATVHSYYLMQNFAYSLHYTQQRNIWIENTASPLFHYQFFRDVWIQFSSGGQVFDSPSFGRLDFGTAVKGVIRIGADKVRAVSDFTATNTFKDSSFLEQGFAIGLDYSLLWTSPDFENTLWGLQVGVVGKNIGTASFLSATPIFELLGYSVANTRKFPVLPNDTSLGLGLKLPNFRDGLRSALRVEWNQWTRPIPTSKKLGVSYEMRFPFLASVYAGYRGGSYAGGVGLRLRGIELDIGSFVDLWGNGAELVERRAWMMELRSVF